jgi:hypothetical protein
MWLIQLAVVGMANPTASRTLRVHHLLHPSRRRKIILGHQQVTLLGNLRRVAQPRTIVSNPRRPRGSRGNHWQSNRKAGEAYRLVYFPMFAFVIGRGIRYGNHRMAHIISGRVSSK